MRRGRVFRRCSKCGRKPGTDQHAALCDGRRWTWSYLVDVNPSGAPRKTVGKGGFASKAEAVERLNELQDSIRRRTYIEPTRLTVASYLQRWLPAVKSDVRPSTFSAYEMHARLYLIPALGEVPLQALTRQDVRAFYNRLADDGGDRGVLSPKTIHNIHLTLHRSLADAIEDRLLQNNPADKAHKLPGDRPEMKVWAPEQLRAFLDYVASDRLFALWRLAATTGMRRGELIGLRWVDLDLDAALLNVVQTRIKGDGGTHFGRPKTKKGRRVVALDETTTLALRSHRIRQAEERLKWGPTYVDEGLVFTRENGAAIDPDVISQMFQRSAKAAGLERIRLHDLRHSYASAALRSGVPTKVVSERLGHASVAFTMDIYSHVLPGMDQEAADRIAGVIDG